MDPQLKGRVVLVTGASGGIGQAVARSLAGEGAHLALHYNRDRAGALAAQAMCDGVRSGMYQADLSDAEQVAAMYAAIVADLGPVTDLVCNAGALTGVQVPLREMPLAQWERTLSVNLTATFLTLRGFLRGIGAAGVADPAVVIVASMSGVWGQPGHADYAAAKAAMVSGLTPTLKDEIVQIAPRGRVNTIAPGFVVTPMIRDKLADAATMRKVLQTASLRRFGQPEEIAHMVTFLLSNALSGHVTGEVIRMAGGKEGRVLFDADEIDL